MDRSTEIWVAAAVAALAALFFWHFAVAGRVAPDNAGNRQDASLQQPPVNATSASRHPRARDAKNGSLPPSASPRIAAWQPDDATPPPRFQPSPPPLPLLAPDSDAIALNPREPAIFASLRASKNVPLSAATRALAEEITGGETNAVGKARAIYDWLTHNIVYDTAEWESIASGATYYIHDHDPDSVLARGSTVCIGYAWLFDDLCEAAGINATWLIGDVRGYRGTPDDALVSDVRHAWNAVELEDGDWHLLDATWGALQDGESESALTRARADYYFDTPASQFIYDHLPENDSWQLLDNAVAEAEFVSLPNLKPSFFTNGLKLGDGYTSVLRAQSGSGAALAFSAPAGIQTLATLGSASGSGESERIRIAKIPAGGDSDAGDSGTTGLAALLPPLSAGDYILRIYSGDGSAGVLECSADFLIHAE